MSACCVASRVASAVVVSSDPSFRKRVGAALAGMRWSVLEAIGGAEALAYMEGAGCEAVLLDSWLPDLRVEEFAGLVRAHYPSVELVMLDVPEAAGADMASSRRHELLWALQQGLDGAPAVPARPSGRETEAVPSAAAAPVLAAAARMQRTEAEGDVPELVGSSEAMRRLGRMIRRVAAHDATVLVTGETGTGKEVVARALHRLSPRGRRPMVVLNCAAIPEALLEAELFGHAKGAFTGAVQARMGRLQAADGGTVFLDEIGELPASLQPKLLRFLQEGEIQRVGDNETVKVDVRIIAATHQALARKADFRPDLYYRLAVFPLEVPSLAHRMEDLPLLAQHFLDRATGAAGAATTHRAKGATEAGRTGFAPETGGKTLAPAALERLLAHDWPGNVRELEHAIERAIILAGDRSVIEAEEIVFVPAPEHMRS